MAKPIVTFEGFAPNYINEDDLKMTIKLVPMEVGNCSYGEVFKVLDKYGVKPQDILGCYKVSASDSSFSIFMANEEVVKMLKEKKVLEDGRLKFMVMCMTDQLVNIRVHWLPLFYDNRIVKAMLSDYGEIQEIRMCKSSYANLVAMNGIREVLIKTDEIKKQQIPHLINFGCGQSVLLTMQGRPPLCLKCKQVGHTRRDCEPRRTFASVASEGRRDDRPNGPAVVEPPAENSSRTTGSEDASLPPPLGAEGSTIAADISGAQQGSSDCITVEMSETTDSKRRREEDEDFIPPNKPARMRPPPSRPVSLENQWSPIMEACDIMVDDS